MRKAILLITWLTLLFAFVTFTAPVLADEVVLKIPKYVEKKSTNNKGQQLKILVLAKDKDDKKEYIEKKLAEFIKEFQKQDLKVDQVELWVEGMVESGGLSKLVLSVKGSGGMKIILRPNK